MELATLRFVESLLSALAAGLLLLPRLNDDDGARYKPAVALAAVLRALFGFGLLIAIARNIIPAQRAIDLPTLLQFTTGTVIGKAWIATQSLSLLLAAAAALRLRVDSIWLERVTLGLAFTVLAVVSVTGHAVDDSLPLYTQLSFPIHTLAGLAWLGGLLGLLWWMYDGRNKPPAVAQRLSERWSLVAKIAMAFVALSGVVLIYENVGSFPNMLATRYGRLLTLKLALLCGAMLLALMLARYLTRPNKRKFDIGWYRRIGAAEAAFGVAVVFVAGWIATVTPAAHENDLYWPLPFRISYKATWGIKVVPWVDSAWWWGVAALALAVAAAIAWFTPALREWRRKSAPAIGVAAFVSAIVSLSVEAYPDTYNDPTVPYTAESITRGHNDFQANCTGCHGVTGEGAGPMAKGLSIAPADLTAPHVGTHTLGDIFHWLTFGGQSGVMPSFADQLEPDDRWDVINFLILLSSGNQSRVIGPRGVVQWLVAPNFPLLDAPDDIVDLEKLRGSPTLISFARCKADDPGFAELEASLKLADETTKASGARHVTVYQGDCPRDPHAFAPAHPGDVEVAYSIINRYLNEPPSLEIPEGHFLVDRSGYIRARFRHFAADDGSLAPLKAQIALTAAEKVVPVSLHEH
jgi:putative copper resistance protein D